MAASSKQPANYDVTSRHASSPPHAPTSIFKRALLEMALLRCAAVSEASGPRVNHLEIVRRLLRG